MPASFSNDILPVQDALVSVCQQFSDPNEGSVTASRTMPDEGITSAQLPYVWVRRGRQTGRNETTSDLFTDTRQYQALIYVSRLTDGEMNDETAFDTALNWVKPFHKHLAKNRTLSPPADIIIAQVRDSGD
ncbi:MAG: hypothetical protein ACPG7F_15800, partial [Aggregatilineales bacterium]